MDGHRGLKNNKVNEEHVRHFGLVLAALEEDSRHLHFVIHATSNVWFSGGLNPLEFLQRLGYRHFPGECPFHQDRCFWMLLATAERDPFADHWHGELIHQTFKRHAQALPDLYDLYQNILSRLELPDTHELDLFPELRTFTPPTLKPGPDSLPDWAVKALPTRFAELESELQRLHAEAAQFRSMAGLLWQTGDPLALAVRDAFRALGYGAELTQKGKTYDITAKLSDSARLLIEVTGIAGPLKKDSPKIGQALQAVQQDAGAGDRVVIAVNAHRDQPLVARAALEVATPEALGLLKGIGTNIIPTSTLFEIWKTFLTDAEGARSRLAELHALGGGMFGISS